MTSGEPAREGSQQTISRRAYLFTALWAVGILLFYAVVGLVGVQRMRHYRAETEASRKAWLASRAAVPGGPTPVVAPSPAATPVAVSILLNHVGGFSLREGSWDADFDIAFRWKNGAVDPGTTFRVANGEIRSRDKETSRVRDSERYERYNVRARIQEYFDPARLPFSDKGLVIEIEDAAHTTQTLRYEVDGKGIRVTRNALAGGLQLIQAFASIKYFAYPFSGRRTDAAGDVHSRFVIALLVQPAGREVYLSMFQALFASVGIALLVFFIKPIHVDPRFGLGVGAFFAAIGNNIFLSTLLPQADRLTLATLVNFVGLLTIFLTLIQSTISLHLYDSRDERRFSRFFDHVSFFVFLAGYFTVNLLLPLAARP